MKALVWSAATYGCESWTLRKNEETHLEAFEMIGLRKSLRASRTAKKTNEWVLNKARVKSQSKEASILWSHHEETRELPGERDNARTCQHIIQTHSLMPGARRRGRPRTAWMDNIKTWTGLSVEESVRMIEDRDKWRKYVRCVANPR